MTREEILQELAGSLIKYWHDEDEGSGDGLADAVCSIIMVEDPELYEDLNERSSQLFDIACGQ